MNKLIFLFPIFFLFLIIPVSAYTEFNYNPALDTNYSGYVIYNEGANATYTFENTTSSGCLVGCLRIIANTSTTFLEIHALNTEHSNFDYDTNSTLIDSLYYAYRNLTIPANREVLLYLSYKSNTTLNSTTSKLYIYNGSSLLSYDLGTTANTWYNSSFIVNSSTTARTMYAYAVFDNDAAALNMTIDKFNIFTYDMNEARSTWTTTDYSQESTRYCGSTTGSVIDINTTQDVIVLYDTTPKDGAGSTTFYCMALKIGNSSYSRRVSKSGSNPTVYYTRDPIYYLVQENGAQAGSMILESLSLHNAKLTTINNTLTTNFCNFGNDSVAGYRCITFNGSPGTSFAWTNLTKDLSIFRTTTDFSSYLNNSYPSGTSWSPRSASGSALGNFSFFSASLEVCTAGRICDIDTNFEYVQTATCEIINSNYCYDWGCMANLSGCNYGFIGSYCIDNFTYKTTGITGNWTYNYCGAGLYCYNKTSTTVECSASYEDFLASNITTTTTTAYDSLITGTDVITSLAIVVGSWFSINDITTSKYIFSLLATIIISFGTALLLAKVGKIHGQSIAQIFIMTAVLMLVLFTAGGYFSTLYLIVLIVISGGILAKLFDLF